MSVGGSVDAIALEGREFAVAADADITRKLGGFENEAQANGNGTVRIVKLRVPWALGGVVIEIDDTRGDQEYIQGLANRNTNFAIAITYVSGVTYQGQGQITDEAPSSSQNTTATISLMGPGEITPQ